MNLPIAARNLRKTYGTVTAVHDFSHDFVPGRITTILGPSGSGKSTLLAMLAGLAKPDSGAVLLDGKNITDLPAERRDFGLVFQNYALFPHLTVVENVAFGLRVRGVGRPERLKQATAALEKVRIAHLAQRRIHQISGGEQQRAALARALAFQPRVLLLDEPLSALDAKLREGLREELGRLLRECGLTTVYVTHDQSEAMGMGDQLLIMRDGRIEQSGSPQEVYARPRTPFVASFLGSANLLDGHCLPDGNGVRLRLSFGEFTLPPAPAAGPCRVVVRPEDIAVADDGPVRGEVLTAVFLGNQVRLTVALAGTTLTVDTSNDIAPTPGSSIALRFQHRKFHLLQPEV